MTGRILHQFQGQDQGQGQDHEKVRRRSAPLQLQMVLALPLALTLTRCWARTLQHELLSGVEDILAVVGVTARQHESTHDQSAAESEQGTPHDQSVVTLT